jgi:type II restriction enzyme
MNKLTASNIVRMIAQLPHNRAYNYINTRTRTRIEIADIEQPEGPIWILRYGTETVPTRDDAQREPISRQMIWRVANAISPNVPINIERILGGSYNTRSALEALLAHTSEFYFCYPGRIEVINETPRIKRGHKHLLWLPSDPHPQGEMRERETQMVISEMPTVDAVYDALILPEGGPEEGINIDIQRRHAQIQVALYEIGKQLGFRIWIAQNDKGIKYKGSKLGELEGVVISLDGERVISAFDNAVRAALLIDCIWFRNTRFMPAVIEIEHTTGVRSGLTRMKNLQDTLPRYDDTLWVIAAPDEDRNEVLAKCNELQFQSLNARFFPYSAIEELYLLCQRRKIRGVTEEFLDCYMEPCLPALQAANS